MPAPPALPPPDVSVVVVTHLGRELALRVLGAARAATGAISVEWLVVDSGSTDGTPDAVAAAWSDVEVVRLANVGFARANNVALARARGRYVLLLNPDLEIAGGTLAELVAAMEAHPEVAVGSGLTRYPDGRLQLTIRRFPSVGRQLSEALQLTRLPGCAALREEEPREARYACEQPADWLSGSFLLVRRTALEAVGGLDERFFLFSEETDWCRRLRSADWEVRHFPVLELVHHTGRSARADLHAQSSWSKVLYARKHFGPAHRAAFRAAVALRHALRWSAFTAARVLRRPGAGTRADAERLALAVVLGRTVPPFAPA